MSNIIIGVDPDSKAHGVAVYINNELRHLFNFELLELMQYIEQCIDRGFDFIEIHIEDVAANNATFAKSFIKNQTAMRKVSNSVGKCQQSQIELERLFEYLEVKVIKHKISKIWKKDKSQFEKVTGWSGRSNEDTRSAAWFGWLGVSSKR